MQDPDARADGQVDRPEAEAKETLQLVRQACRSSDQENGLNQIAESLRSYEVSKAAKPKRDQNELVKILEECLRGPIFLTSWLDHLRSRMGGVIVMVSADEASFRSLVPIDRQQVVGRQGAAVAGQVTQADPLREGSPK